MRGDTTGRAAVMPSNSAAEATAIHCGKQERIWHAAVDGTYVMTRNCSAGLQTWKSKPQKQEFPKAALCDKSINNNRVEY